MAHAVLGSFSISLAVAEGCFRLQRFGSASAIPPSQLGELCYGAGVLLNEKL